MRHRRRFLLFLVIVALMDVACSSQGTTATTVQPTTTSSGDPSEDPNGALPGTTLAPDPPLPDIEELVADLLSKMTLDEKIGQMTLIEKDSLAPGDVATYALGAVLSGGGGSPPDNNPAAWVEMVDRFMEEALSTRLGIPILYGVDAIHGHANVMGATVFPHNIGLGATGDAELVERIGRATAIETSATGIRWNFGPVLAVPSDLRWGRTYEAYGEKPSLVAELGTSYIRGLQGDDLSDPTSVLATAKHFIGDGSTVFGTSTIGDYLLDQGVAPADEQLLHDVLVPPYRAAVEAGVGSVMGSFSSWGEAKVHAQRELLTDLLRRDLGFTGFLVSDWGAIDQIDPDYQRAVGTAVNAGVDMNMVPYDPVAFISTLRRAVELGDVPMERIDEAVTRILTAKFQLGLFEQPHRDPGLLAEVGSDQHRALAREAVAKSAVLLKNDDVLPLSKETQTIFVAGLAADDVGIQSGGWTITWQGRSGPMVGGTSLLEGLVAGAPQDANVVYNRHGRLTGENAGLRPDVCIVVLGEEPYAEGWGDSTDLALPGVDMTRTLREPCPQLAVVIISGRPVIITDRIDGWDAVVAAWLPGSEGAGIADVLFGHQPFTGKLPVTWPRSVEQLPLGSSDEDPLFPVGFGLTAD